MNVPVEPRVARRAPARGAARLLLGAVAPVFTPAVVPVFARARAPVFGLAFALAFVSVFVPVLGCQRPRRADEAVTEAREAAALAWVDALGAGDGATLARLTTDPFLFRGVGGEHPCEDLVAGRPALEAWLTCLRGKAELRRVTDSWKDFRQPAQNTPESAALRRYLPHVVRGDDVWSRFVGAEERARSRGALDALAKEAGRDGAWITIAANGLSARLTLRLQLVGAGADARVHAALAHVTRTSD